MEQRSTDKELLSVQAGLSPHAPYTMSIDFLSDCAQRCIDRSWLLSMHVAESMEEMEWWPIEVDRFASYSIDLLQL